MHGNMTRITNIQSDLNSDIWSASNYCIIGRELTNLIFMRCCHSVNVSTICRSQRMHVQNVSLLEQCVRYVVLLQLGQCKLSGKSRQHRVTYRLYLALQRDVQSDPGVHPKGTQRQYLRRSLRGKRATKNEKTGAASEWRLSQKSSHVIIP